MATTNLSLFESGTFFANVMPLAPVRGSFTYRIPQVLNHKIKRGQRVIVEFGKRRVISAIVLEVHQQPPQDYKAKYLTDIQEEEPAFSETTLKFLEWMSQYYAASLGEVFNAALPSGLKIGSETRIQIHPDFEGSTLNFSPAKLELWEYLKQRDSLSYAEAEKLISGTKISSLIKELISIKAIILFEQLRDKYQPKKIRRVRMAESVLADPEKTFTSLKRSPAMQDALLWLWELHKRNPNQFHKEAEIVEKGISAPALKGLEAKGFIIRELKLIPRHQFPDEDLQPLPKLSEKQSIALNQISSAFSNNQITYLQGLTGSGKTAIYQHLIQQVIDSGGQALFLLPEIGLTTQMVWRLSSIFGSKLGIYHSKYSDNERVEIWNGLKEDRLQVILGVRSSLFLPFSNLGLIIIDEEHESSYKQHDPAPRYHARDAALVLARLHNAKVLMGSATPTVEAFHQMQSKKWAQVILNEVFFEGGPPQWHLIDLKETRRFNRMVQGFDREILDTISSDAAQRNQSLVFHNLRGFARQLQCETCGNVPNCPNCSVSLVFHQKAQELRCHYCGFRESIPPVCKACSSPNLTLLGKGTERIEEDLKALLPDLRIIRMDQDTTRTRNKMQQLINQMEDRQADVLVGTQMVSKGLDFAGLKNVIVPNADALLNYPDFRARERTFQLLTQVAGRAGRRKLKGQVYIQTYLPNAFFKQVMDGDLDALYQTELLERQLYNYPPFSRLIKVTCLHPDILTAQKLSNSLAKVLATALPSSAISGPAPGLIEKLRNQFVFDILLKINPTTTNLKSLKDLLIINTLQLQTPKGQPNVEWILDIDPV